MFGKIFANAVIGASKRGVKSFLAVCRHSGNAMEAALDSFLGVGVVVEGTVGKARVVEYGNGTKLAIPRKHLSMDAYHLTSKAGAVANCTAAVTMFKVPCDWYSWHALVTLFRISAACDPKGAVG
jgi:hypothetical protein